MSRPLALIQGDLALPNARLLRGLPPPYGVYRWPGRAAAPRRPQPAKATEAQQANHYAARSKMPLARHTPFAPPPKFRFFYKLPQPRDYSSRFDAQLAETRHYLATGRTRPYSSRSDHVLGAVIFVACSIVLAWLLTTSATHDADKAAAVVLTRPAVPMHHAPAMVHPQASARLAQRVAEVASTVAQRARAAANPAPQVAIRSEPEQLPQARLPVRHVPLRQHIERNRSAAQVDERLASSRAIRPATRPSISAQREWVARPSVDDTTGQAAWFDRAAQQRRANVTTRASVATPDDIDWNARMTQRRITDDPNAFEAPSGQN